MIKSQDLKEYILRNWIKELAQQGVTQGQNGEPLQNLDYVDLLRLKVRQEVRKGMDN